MIGLFRLFCLILIFSSSFAQWVPQHSGTDAHFRAISAVDDKTLWAGGSKGTILRTTNGGQKWEVIHVPGAEKLDFRGISALDKKTAVAVSAGLAEEGQAQIYRTDDAGKTWRQVWKTDQKGVFLDGVAFWDKQNGLIFGDPVDRHYFLLKTGDGGNTWNRLQPGLLPATLPDEASFAASNTNMVVQGTRHVWIGTGGADHARVFYSDNRGVSWQVSDTPMQANASSGIFGLRFWDTDHGIAVGGDYKADKAAFENVILTEDGGKTWKKAAPTTPDGLKEAVCRLKNGALVAVGPAGSSVSKDNGQTWQPLTNAPVGLHTLACVGNTCWAIGAKGAVASLQLTK